MVFAAGDAFAENGNPRLVSIFMIRYVVTQKMQCQSTSYTFTFIMSSAQLSLH